MRDLRRKRTDLPGPFGPGGGAGTWKERVTGATRRDKPAEPRIRCPRCAWRPRRSDLWHCGSNAAPEGFAPGCGTAWHTFDTRGLCPGCGHQWRFTCCLKCARWSPHDDWYAKDEGGTGTG